MTQPVEQAKNKAEAKVNGNVAGSVTKSPALYLYLKDIGLEEDFNIRNNIPEHEVKNLAVSIQASKGLKTPLTCEEVAPGKYVLRSGFTRRLALLSIDWKEPVPVMLEKYENETDAMVGNLTENAARTEVSAFDTAKRLHFLLSKGVTRDTLSARTTLQPGSIDNLVRAFEKLEPSILAFWSLRKPETAVELPSNKAIVWAGKSHVEQVKLFKEWKDEREAKAARAASRAAGAAAGATTNGLPALEPIGEGEGSKPGPVILKAKTPKEVKAKVKDLETQLKTLRDEAKELKAEGKEAKAVKREENAEEMSLKLSALKWVAGLKANL